MKWFVKKLPFFSVVYLHNPLQCERCLAVESYEEIKKTFDETFVAVKPTQKKKSKARNLKAVKKSRTFKSEREIINPVVEICVKKRKRVEKNKSIGPVSSKKVKKQNKVVKKIISKPGFKKKNSKTPKRNSIAKCSLKTVPQKKQTIKKKNNITKEGGKGTLKRKRSLWKKLKESNDNYEDDIFENKKFGHFQNLLEDDDSDGSEKYEGIKTPELPYSLTPRERTPSPVYKDCYSPTELSRSRKDAEEYIYRRTKKRRDDSITKNETRKPKPPSIKIDVEKTLKKVAQILKDRQAQIEAANASDEDQYFSDC